MKMEESKDYELMNNSCMITHETIINRKDHQIFQNISQQELVVL